MSVKTQIHAKLNRIKSINPDQSSNIAPYLADIYFYTEMKKYAENHIKNTYKLLVKDKLLPDDDELRQQQEHVAAKTPSFTLLSKTTSPRVMFDKDEFINRVSSTFNIPKHQLMKISNETTKQSKAPLTKSVIENKA